MSADEDVDFYELGLRQNDARRTILIGIVLMALSAAGIVTWFMVVRGMAALGWVSPRLLLVLGLAGSIGALGVGSVIQGFRKRSTARAMERSLAPSGASSLLRKATLWRGCNGWLRCNGWHEGGAESTAWTRASRFALVLAKQQTVIKTHCRSTEIATRPRARRASSERVSRPTRSAT